MKRMRLPHVDITALTGTALAAFSALTEMSVQAVFTIVISVHILTFYLCTGTLPNMQQNGNAPQMALHGSGKMGATENYGDSWIENAYGCLRLLDVVFFFTQDTMGYHNREYLY